MPPETFGLVIPTYRRAAYVREAVRSARRQTVPFDRIVVVCDGPQDEVEAVLAGTGVEVLVVPHGGVAAARNAGVAALDTDWVSFLDDDDLLHPDYLSRVRDFASAHPTEGALNAWYWVFGGHGDPDADFAAASYDECLAALPTAVSRRRFDYLEIHGRSFDLLLEKLRGSQSGAAVRRRVLEAAGGFPSGLRCAEDWTMYVNVARFTEWSVLRERLVLFRNHPATNTLTGGPRNGVDTLRAIAAFWAESRMPEPSHRPLRAYRADYRFTLRWTLDAARRARNPGAYREALVLARAVLPERRDRLAAMVPGGIWDATRAVVGRLRRGSGRGA
ncbi:glycosyltransferase family 2 protein [Gryllotalpicola ginsengisoli]|uniref:glycosyltransferase family 2 protein n=1 Tax=Gryllotalpicola ginsengisoli TaxID=444608 RepID=UPI0003B53BD8|nr:glycosyltransferase family 2 protein [Gryllotalpicola ginsengisoli]